MNKVTYIILNNILSPMQSGHRQDIYYSKQKKNVKYKYIIYT